MLLTGAINAAVAVPFAAGMLLGLAMLQYVSFIEGFHLGFEPFLGCVITMAAFFVGGGLVEVVSLYERHSYGLIAG